MKFNYTKFSKEKRFSIGIEENSGKYFISFPVINTTMRYVEDEEYFEISKQEYDLFTENLNNALELLERCRKREEEDRLLHQPFKERGTPSY